MKKSLTFKLSEQGTVIKMAKWLWNTKPTGNENGLNCNNYKIWLVVGLMGGLTHAVRSESLCPYTDPKKQSQPSWWILVQLFPAGIYLGSSCIPGQPLNHEREISASSNNTLCIGQSKLQSIKVSAKMCWSSRCPKILAKWGGQLLQQHNTAALWQINSTLTHFLWGGALAKITFLGLELLEAPRPLTV